MTPKFKVGDVVCVLSSGIDGDEPPKVLPMVVVALMDHPTVHDGTKVYLLRPDNDKDEDANHIASEDGILTAEEATALRLME